MTGEGVFWLCLSMVGGFVGKEQEVSHATGLMGLSNYIYVNVTGKDILQGCNSM